MKPCSRFARIREAALKALLRARLGFFLVFRKCGLESSNIHGEAVFPRHLLREFDGEAKGVIKAEGRKPVDAAIRKTPLNAFKFTDAVFERLLEALFLAGKLRHDLIPVCGELRIEIPILGDDGLRNMLEAVLGHAKLHCIADRPADQPAQNIALIDIGRGYAPRVAQDERGATHMVRDDAECARGFMGILVAFVGEFGNAGDDPGKRVGIIHAFHALQRSDGAVKPHAGVHIALREGFDFPAFGLEILHEHVVPDLKVFPAIAGRIAALGAFGLTGIIENLRIRAAGAGSAGDPPVMLCAEVENVGRIDAHLHPAVVRFGVARGVFIPFKAGEVETVLIDAKPFFVREKFPGIGDGLLLEIITQRPVAKHLKEGAVGTVAHFVNIPGAHAFLHIHKALSGRMRLPHQVRNQRMHSGRCKEHRWVIFRDQGSGRNHGMPAFAEKLEVECAQFLGSQVFHGITPHL